MRQCTTRALQCPRFRNHRTEKCNEGNKLFPRRLKKTMFVLDRETLASTDELVKIGALATVNRQSII